MATLRFPDRQETILNVLITIDYVDNRFWFTSLIERLTTKKGIHARSALGNLEIERPLSKLVGEYQVC